MTDLDSIHAPVLVSGESITTPYIQGKTIRHHDFPRQFELEFLQAGYDPDTVGRALSGEFHKGLHRGKGWGRGGAWNYQWYQFFHGTEDGMHFDKFMPHESIKAFLDKLRQVDPAIGNWPYTNPSR